MRFWDSIGIGLAGGDHFSTTNLGLDSGDLVTNFIRADVSLLLLTGDSTLTTAPAASNIPRIHKLRPPLPYYPHLNRWQIPPRLAPLLTAHSQPLILPPSPLHILLALPWHLPDKIRTWQRQLYHHRQQNIRWRTGRLGTRGHAGAEVGHALGRLGGAGAG